MSSHDPVRTQIEAAGKAVESDLRQCVLGVERLTIVQAPPGSGKTYQLTRAAVSGADGRGRLRVAIACQTNSQADDVARRLAEMGAAAPIVRFASGRASKPADLSDAVRWVTSGKDLPHERCIVVSTTAKWSLSDLPDPFDILFVDEAWQLAHMDFQVLTRVAGRFVFIGDPGQIPPVVTVPTLRWETSPQPPHRPAPEVMRAIPDANPRLLQLPATRRLPFDSARLVRNFYDFDFASYAGPGERALLYGGRGGDAVDRALRHLAGASVALSLLPTPPSGPPMEVDADVVARCVELAGRALRERSTCVLRDGRHDLAPESVGISATHRKMVTAIGLALPPALRPHIRVDTPERWQGLECDLMIVVHPLSGVVQPSEFDLETGRLCVMASRHRCGLVIVSRDHLATTLERTAPSATQPVGVDDIAGRVHARHVQLLASLTRSNSVFAP